MGFPIVLAWCPCPNLSAHFLGLPCPGHQQPQLTAPPASWVDIQCHGPVRTPFGGAPYCPRVNHGGPAPASLGSDPCPSSLQESPRAASQTGGSGSPRPNSHPYWSVPHSCLLLQKWGRHPGFCPSPYWRPRGPDPSIVATVGPALAPGTRTRCQARSPPAPPHPPDSPLHPERTPSPVAAGAPALATPDSPTPRPRSRPRRVPSICELGPQSPPVHRAWGIAAGALSRQSCPCCPREATSTP